MANTRHTIGLRPIDQPYGNIRANYYEAATGVALYMFQPVTLDANGRIIFGVANSAGSALLGSVLGFADDSFCPLPNPYLAANPGLAYTANSAGLVKVFVADDPNQFYVIEENTGGTALDAQAVGASVSFTYLASGTGNTTNGIANAVLLRATAGAVNNGVNSLRLIKKWDKLDNAYGNYCKWIVKIDNHFMTATSSGGVI